MLEDLHLDQIARASAIPGPHLVLQKAHAIEYFLGLAVEAVGELLGIGKCAADALDLTRLTADIARRAPVPRGKARLYPHGIADREAVPGRRRIRRGVNGRDLPAGGRHRCVPFLSGDSISSGTSKRLRISAIFAASSCSVM